MCQRQVQTGSLVTTKPTKKRPKRLRRNDQFCNSMSSCTQHCRASARVSSPDDMDDETLTSPDSESDSANKSCKQEAPDPFAAARTRELERGRGTPDGWPHPDRPATPQRGTASRPTTMPSPLRITLSACLNPKAGRDGLQAAGMPHHPPCPSSLGADDAHVRCPARRARRDVSAGCPMRLRRRRGPVRPGRGDPPPVRVQTAAPPPTTACRLAPTTTLILLLSTALIHRPCA